MAKNGNIEQNGMQIHMDMTATVKGESTYEIGIRTPENTTSTSDYKRHNGRDGTKCAYSSYCRCKYSGKKIIIPFHKQQDYLPSALRLFPQIR